MPAQGAARTTVTSTSSNPPSFNFYYDEAAGNFEQRLGGACNAGQNNQTCLTVTVQMPTITACSYQASWDAAPVTCTAAEVAFVNNGGSFVLATDRYGIDPVTCTLSSPLRSSVPFDTPAWFKVNVVIGGVTSTRTLDFVKPPTRRGIAKAAQVKTGAPPGQRTGPPPCDMRHAGGCP